MRLQPAKALKRGPPMVNAAWYKALAAINNGIPEGRERVESKKVLVSKFNRNRESAIGLLETLCADLPVASVRGRYAPGPAACARRPGSGETASI
jgi:hypothetical protein